MRKEEVKKIVTEIVFDFGELLTEGIMENQDLFPYTNACIRFISDLQSHGICINFDSFDQEIVDKVYCEMCEFLIH